jgi:hypothetical protein
VVEVEESENKPQQGTAQNEAEDNWDEINPFEVIYYLIYVHNELYIPFM